jgi:sugar/nucleoside kinase (ribokinase family)
VGLKCGRKGLYLRTGTAYELAGLGRARPGSVEAWAERELFEPSFEVKHVASATGSGDCAIAGFLCAFLRGESLESAARFACAVGAHNVMAMDAVSGVKSWRETASAIRRGWRKNTIKLPAPGWRFERGARRWIGPHDRKGTG